MSDELKFNEATIKQLTELLNSPAFDQLRRQQHASQLRNEATADWITNFMNRMQAGNVPEYMLNKETGQLHTVESMVESLKQRVGLEQIKKDASMMEIPLTAKAIQKKKTDTELTDDKKQNVSRFIDDFFSSHRGYADIPAVLYACRDKFGSDVVADNLDFFMEAIEGAKEKNQSPGISVILPSPYQGQPMKVDLQHDLFQPLFEHIKNL